MLHMLKYLPTMLWILHCCLILVTDGQHILHFYHVSSKIHAHYCRSIKKEYFVCSMQMQRHIIITTVCTSIHRNLYVMHSHNSCRADFTLSLDHYARSCPCRLFCECLRAAMLEVNYMLEFVFLIFFFRPTTAWRGCVCVRLYVLKKLQI